MGMLDAGAAAGDAVGCAGSAAGFAQAERVRRVASRGRTILIGIALPLFVSPSRWTVWGEPLNVLGLTS